MIDYVATFVFFFAVIDPVGTVPVFMAVMVSVLAITLVLMLAATPLLKLIRTSGAAVISRVMGMILASVAMANVLAGIRDYFGL